ncbi:MAG: phosphatidate cytidylyltransferase [Phycisphaerales bacterium]|nr:phosphatidate cytidylyltransferase [Phycisphaerales bacterium]
MRKRLIVGIALALVILVGVGLDGWLANRRPFSFPMPGTGLDLGIWACHGLISTAIIFVLTFSATRELVALARARGYRPFGRTAQFFATILVLGPYISFHLKPVAGAYDESWGLFWMANALACVFLLQALLHKTEKAMENIATTIFIVFYAGGLGSFMTKLRMEVEGSTGVLLLVFSVFLVKMTDTGAYFVGSLTGRHKMVAWLSPKKTWEGFAGGMATTILCAVGVGLWLQSAGYLVLREPRVPFVLAMVLLGLLLGLFSAAGDLCASLLKRDAAVKDSGQALPGLGGVLDVLDSPLLAAPVAWVFWTRLFHVAP